MIHRLFLSCFVHLLSSKNIGWKWFQYFLVSERIVGWNRLSAAYRPIIERIPPWQVPCVWHNPLHSPG